VTYFIGIHADAAEGIQVSYLIDDALGKNDNSYQNLPSDQFGLTKMKR